VEQRTPFTSAYTNGQVLRIPAAHGEGRFIAPAEVLERIEGEGQVVFRYVDPAGSMTDAANPNGSVNNIAGIVNAAGNVMGMMPHPERYVEDTLGGADGCGVFRSLSAALETLVA
jgi:phosphoribosylformylglycinamidine synthase